MEPEQPPGELPGDANSLKSKILDAALDLWVQSGSSHLVPVSGRSMLPLLREGDNLLVSHMSEGVRPGDILVFQSERGLVAHRVIAIVSQDGGVTGYITKGDNTNSMDPLVLPGQILGRVQAIQKGKSEKRVDNLLWRGFGRLIAKEMRLVSVLPGKDRQNQPGGLARIWRGGLRRFIRLQLKIFQILFAG